MLFLPGNACKVTAGFSRPSMAIDPSPRGDSHGCCAHLVRLVLPSDAAVELKFTMDFCWYCHQSTPKQCQFGPRAQRTISCLFGLHLCMDPNHESWRVGIASWATPPPSLCHFGAGVIGFSLGNRIRRKAIGVPIQHLLGLKNPGAKKRRKKLLHHWDLLCYVAPAINDFC